MKKLVTSAEKALSALADREALVSLAAAEQSGAAQTSTNRSNTPATTDYASSSGLLLTPSAAAPHVHHRHIRRASIAAQDGKLAIEDVDRTSSASDREDVSSISSSTTTGPLR